MDEFRFLDKSDPDLLICGRHEYCHKVLLKAVFNILVKSFHNETFFLKSGHENQMGVQIPKNNGKQEIRKSNNEIAGSLSLRKIFQESI